MNLATVPSKTDLLSKGDEYFLKTYGASVSEIREAVDTLEFSTSADELARVIPMTSKFLSDLVRGTQRTPVPPPESVHVLVRDLTFLIPGAEEIVLFHERMVKAPLKMGRAGASSINRLREASLSGNSSPMFGHPAKEMPDEMKSILMFGDAMVIVVQHDWSAAFSKATDFDGGDFRMPSSVTYFDFRVNGTSILLRVEDSLGAETSPSPSLSEGLNVLMMWENPITRKWAMMSMFDIEEGSITRTRSNSFENDRFKDMHEPLFKFLWGQVRSAVIAIEAEAAVTETVRVSEKLQHARARAGKPPMLDYHVVSLARRQRAAPLPDDHIVNERGPGVRMHFRRGHWRHYADHKTWIKWQLVGNPDLGFIDKHYKL